MQNRALMDMPAGGTDLATTVSTVAISGEVALERMAELFGCFENLRVVTMVSFVEVLLQMLCVSDPHAADYTVASEPAPEKTIVQQPVPAMQ